MATATDIITRALLTANINGVGQAPSTADLNYGLVTLNNMLALWSKRRWLVYDDIDVVFQGTGAISYAIGSGGTINTPRPDRIESAFVRLKGTGLSVDFPLEIVQAREDYNRIGVKSLVDFPRLLFYDSGYPLGAVYIWPLPSANYEVHLSIKNTFLTYALTDVVTLPPEYMEAIDYNIVLRLSVGYGRNVTPSIAGLARASLETIRTANTQIAQLQIPAFSGGSGAGAGALFSSGSSGSTIFTGIDIQSLPTTLPAGAGVLWNDGGMLAIS